MTDAENGEEGMYTGSGRNPDKSAVAELKPLLESTGLFEFVSGHVNAFGVKIHRSNIARMVETVNGLIGNNESVVYVDFILSDIDFDTAAILHKEVRPYCGTGFAEPLVAIDELILRRNNMVVMGKYSNSWKYEDDNMCFVKFGVPDGDPVMEWINEESAGNTISITAFGNVGINQWLGKVSGQMIIREYDVLSKE